MSWSELLPSGPGKPPMWVVEGVVCCPGDCGLYFDFNGTPQDLQKFTDEHDCAVAQIGSDFR